MPIAQAAELLGVRAGGLPNSVLEYQVPIAQAAELLGVSQRHARRLLAAYREQGAAALAHGNRGRRPHNAIPPAQAAAVVELATQRYEGANHTHFTELLSEREGIDLSRPGAGGRSFVTCVVVATGVNPRRAARRILTKAGIGSPRSRRSPQHRFRRQRMPQAGMLVQLDGSHHAWLEDRGPKFALLLAVDDATGTAVNAVFRTGEDTRGYFMLLDGLIQRWGIPLALYSDRHAVFKHNARPPETAGEATQFTRGLQELGIRQIFARSPQAKGRVERMAETFQDRLVTELRLADARTIGQATAVLRDFLPRFNARFAVQPEHPDAAYRPVAADLCLSETLCFKHTRKVGRDNTVKYHWRVLQLLPDRERPSYAGLRVEVLERPDSELIVQYQGHTVATQEPPPRMGALWAAVSPWSPGPELRRIVSSVGDHHISKSPQRRLAALEPVRIDEARVKTVAEKDVVSKAPATWGRTPTPTQKARWKAIQQARLKGLSLRAIAKELGIARDTVRKYAYAEQPPTKKLSAQERAKLKALRKSATVAN